ncbi:hypothetical protein BO85DRAFT_14517 [Aspergillus piperis CBS 112811]|uniref:Uncharacterized protein n=1 Tax=Aspergillus piperis CBS 112811 TaxID=1448313 RepID=A0A8G1RBA4_9EURO|nr:hypothetical protein BO85DRAFT_14517 [Aspergillus piperis CBS 112811]RAH62994.1 hypothetical protein BO85DRAFT_14517 [Aspergillus piperis CBS 112811]
MTCKHWRPGRWYLCAIVVALVSRHSPIIMCIMSLKTVVCLSVESAHASFGSCSMSPVGTAVLKNETVLAKSGQMVTISYCFSTIVACEYKME